MSNLTVISICTIDPTNWKRPVYSKDWVDRLYRGISRNLDIPFRFVCLSNDISSADYEVIPLVTNSWGWWYKMEMFRQNAFTGPCLYIDIDNVICKNITDSVLGLPRDKMLMPREPYKDILNGSVIFWEGDYSFLYEAYVRDQENITKKYMYATDEHPATGDQGLYRDLVTNLDCIDDYVKPGFFGWKHHIAGTYIDNPSMLIFTSTEKPSNNLDLDLVQKHWIN